MADKIHSLTNHGFGLEHHGLRLGIKSLALAVKSLASRIKSLIMTLVVSADTVNTFKHHLDKFWCNEDVIYNYKADLGGTGKCRTVLLLGPKCPDPRSEVSRPIL